MHPDSILNQRPGAVPGQKDTIMKKQAAHAIENLANELNMSDWRGKISLVLCSEEKAREDRPNEFLLTRGKNGWTRCIQESYYFNVCRLCNHDGLYIHKEDRNGEVLNGNWEQGGSYHKVDYREHTDSEILEIVEEIRAKGVTSKSEFGGWYIVNE